MKKTIELETGVIVTIDKNENVKSVSSPYYKDDVVDEKPIQLFAKKVKHILKID